MRDREVIEREMFRAREDLESSVAELKHVVQEKIDVKARARVAFARGKETAALALERGAQTAKHAGAELYGRAKARPVVTGAIIGAIVGTVALAYIGRKKSWW